MLLGCACKPTGTLCTLTLRTLRLLQREHRGRGEADAEGEGPPSQGCDFGQREAQGRTGEVARAAGDGRWLSIGSVQVCVWLYKGLFNGSAWTKAWPLPGGTAAGPDSLSSSASPLCSLSLSLKKKNQIRYWKES